MFLKKYEKRAFILAAIWILIMLYTVYGTYNQRYVGACDWYGYFQQAQLLKQGKIFMETSLPVSKFRCLAPLSYFEKDGRIIPQYPPGYPVLLAIGGLVGLEYYVNPIIGLLSVILMFLLIRDLTDQWTGLLFATLWGFFPIVVSGSTYVMSDLSATFFVMLAYYCFKKKKIIPSAFALAFSLAIRPTNALFCAIFLPMVLWELKEKKQWLKYGLWFGAFSSLYALYNWYVYGAPWKTGYMDISYDLTASVFNSHFLYYVKEIWTQFSPLLVILALVGLLKKEKERIFFLYWFLVFFIFYCFWRSGGDAWWWLRFFLPGLPTLFFLAALGFKRVQAALQCKNKILRRSLRTALILAVVWVNGYMIELGKSYSELWAQGKSILFYDISINISKAVEKGAMIGALDFSGALKLYGHTDSFNTLIMDSVDLISELLKTNKPVYVLVEPWNKESPVIVRIFKNFRVEKMPHMGGWEDLFLYRIKSQRLDFLL